MKFLIALGLLFSLNAFAAKPDKPGKGEGKLCRQEIRAKIKALKKEIKACKGVTDPVPAPIPEPVPEPLPEEPLP
jgi:hypothetical protein